MEPVVLHLTPTGVLDVVGPAGAAVIFAPDHDFKVLGEFEGQDAHLAAGLVQQRDPCRTDAVLIQRAKLDIGGDGEAVGELHAAVSRIDLLALDEKRVTAAVGSAVFHDPAGRCRLGPFGNGEHAVVFDRTGVFLLAGELAVHIGKFRAGFVGAQSKGDDLTRNAAGHRQAAVEHILAAVIRNAQGAGVAACRPRQDDMDTVVLHLTPAVVRDTVDPGAVVVVLSLDHDLEILGEFDGEQADHTVELVRQGDAGRADAVGIHLSEENVRRDCEAVCNGV